MHASLDRSSTVSSAVRSWAQRCLNGQNQPRTTFLGVEAPFRRKKKARLGDRRCVLLSETRFWADVSNLRPATVLRSFLDPRCSHFFKWATINGFRCHPFRMLSFIACLVLQIEFSRIFPHILPMAHAMSYTTPPGMSSFLVVPFK